jgi:hypothetical protein
MQTLLPQAPATASTRFTGLPFPFSFTFPLLFPILFSFPFSFFSFLFLFSFYFLFFYFTFLSPLLPFLIYLFLIALLDGARKGIINSYQHFYRYNYKNYFPIFKNF